MTPELLMQGCFAVIGALALLVFKGMAESVRKLGQGVDELNIKIAVVIERVDSHEKRIHSLEGRKHKGE